MNNRLIDKILSIVSRPRSGDGSPEAAMERLLREMNKTVPVMTGAAARLRERILAMGRECGRISGEIERARGGKNLDGPRESLRRAEQQLEAARTSHAAAVSAIHAFIAEKRKALAETVAILAERERDRRRSHRKALERRLAVIGHYDPEEEPHAGSRPAGTDGSAAAWTSRIREGRLKTSRIREMSGMAPHKSVGVLIDQTAAAAERILDYLEGRPDTASAARSFMSYYLDSVLNIIEGYLKLLDRGKPGDEITERLRSAEAAIAEIAPAFTKILANIMERDLIRLDAEISVLKKSLESEDLA